MADGEVTAKVDLVHHHMTVLPITWGCVFVQAGLVFRFRDGAAYPDGVAGAGSEMGLDLGDRLMSPTGARLSESDILTIGGRTRDLLWVREALSADRVARALVLLADVTRYGMDDPTLPDGIYQRDIGLLAAARHETVSRELAALRKCRLIAGGDLSRVPLHIPSLRRLREACR